MHHRTDWDLACELSQPGACEVGEYAFSSDCDPAAFPQQNESNDARCQERNRLGKRFDWVHSQDDRNVVGGNIYNGHHEALSESQGLRVLAYIYDARPGSDADGYISPNNPFFDSTIHQDQTDCDDDIRFTRPGQNRSELIAPTFTNPSAGEAVRGSVVIEVQAHNPFGTTEVEWLVNGNSIGRDATAPYQHT